MNVIISYIIYSSILKLAVQFTLHKPRLQIIMNPKGYTDQVYIHVASIISPLSLSLLEIDRGIVRSILSPISRSVGTFL